MIGSKDASGEICDAYAQQDGRVRVVHKENTGVSDTRIRHWSWRGNVSSVFGQRRLDRAGYVRENDGADGKYSVRLVCAGRWDVSSETGEKTLGLCPPKEEVISGEDWCAGFSIGRTSTPPHGTSCTIEAFLRLYAILLV